MCDAAARAARSRCAKTLKSNGMRRVTNFDVQFEGKLVSDEVSVDSQCMGKGQDSQIRNCPRQLGNENNRTIMSLSFAISRGRLSGRQAAHHANCQVNQHRQHHIEMNRRDARAACLRRGDDGRLAGHGSWCIGARHVHVVQWRGVKASSSNPATGRAWQILPVTSSNAL